MKKSLLFMLFFAASMPLLAQTTYEIAQDCNENGASYMTESAKQYQHQWVDMGLPSGLKWATTNVGASNMEDYGYYFAWGECTPKQSYDQTNYFDSNDGCHSFIKYKTNGGKTQLDLTNDAAHSMWGGDWRMPTKTEWEELLNYCTVKLDSVNHVLGYTLTSVANEATLFIPAAGYALSSKVYAAGYDCDMWTSTLKSTDVDAWYALFSDIGIGMRASFRDFGRSVRAVCKASGTQPKVYTVKLKTGECGDSKMITIKAVAHETITFEAIADDGYHFAQWSDGNTENPRTVEVKKNITYTAQFAEGEGQGLNDLESEIKPTKLIRDGQIYILRHDGKLFTVTGVEVK